MTDRHESAKNIPKENSRNDNREGYAKSLHYSYRAKRNSRKQGSQKTFIVPTERKNAHSGGIFQTVRFSYTEGKYSMEDMHKTLNTSLEKEEEPMGGTDTL